MRCSRSGRPGVLAAGLLAVLAVPAVAQPTISQLDAFFPSTTSPGGAAITAGTPLPNGFSLQLTGTNFATPFVVSWIDNNNPANNKDFASSVEAAFLVNSTTILVPTVPASLIAAPTSVTIRVTVGLGQTASAPFTVNAPLPAAIPVGGPPIVLPQGVVGGPYAQPLFPTGDGTAQFTISLFSGSLPPGMPAFGVEGTVNPDGNFYVGSPTAEGVYTFRLAIVDAWLNSTALSYSLTVSPAPTITSLNPPLIPAGSLGFTLTVNGTNFTAGSVVSWRSALTGNTNLATTYVSPTQLTAVVPAGLIQAHDLPVIRVTVPGGAFIEANYIVQYPIISGVSPPYVTAGHPAYTLTVTGQYFLTVPSVTQIFLAGVRLPTVSPSPGVLQATVPASMVATPGTPTFWVQNPGGQVSFAFGDYLVLPPDVLTSLNPTNRLAGPGSLSLTLNGTNLVNVASVLWDQSAITQFGITGSAQVTVTIPAALLTPGVHTVGILTTDGTPSNTLPFTVISPLTITNPAPPAGTAGQYYSFTLTAGGGSTPYRWSATGLPAGLSFNQATGVISGAPSSDGSSTVSVTVTDSGQRSASAQYTLTINPAIPPLQITTPSLPNGVTGTGYSAQLSASGGVPGYSFTLTQGSLPPGLALSLGGVLAGIPTKPGDSGFTVEVTDSRGATSVAGFVLTIKVPPLVITTPPFTDTPVGTSFNTQFGATGGVPPYVWGVSGSVPAGTVLKSNGLLSGTANSVATFQFTIQVTDSTGTAASRTYSINITQLPLTISGKAGNGQVGVPYSVTFSATGGQPPYSWAASGLPAGLSFSGTSITGTPAVGSEGPYTVTVTATDAGGAKASANSTITIIPPALQVTTTSLPNGTVGGGYSATVSASGGVPPYTYSASGLPPGVSISAAGVISGAIGDTVAPGSFTVTATVTDSKGTIITRTFTVTVTLPPLAITGISASTAVAGSPFTATATASGGVPPYTWSGSGPGVSVSAGGTITGTFTALGPAAITLSVKDSAGTTASRTVQVIVGLPAAPTLSLGGLPGTANPASQSMVQATLGTPYPVDVVLTLTMMFTSDSGPDDPAVQFSTGGRTVQITVTAGGTMGTSSVGVQTGTVAGTITITTQMQAAGQDITPTPAPQQSVRINAGAPVIRSVTATRSTGTFTVTVVGYATDRELTQAVFQFTAANGANLQTSSVTVPIDQLFATWYGSAASAPFGSQFTLTQPFTVQGDPAAVVSVTVTLTNKIGSSTPVNATLQ